MRGCRDSDPNKDGPFAVPNETVPICTSSVLPRVAGVVADISDGHAEAEQEFIAVTAVDDVDALEHPKIARLGSERRQQRHDAKQRNDSAVNSPRLPRHHQSPPDARWCPVRDRRICVNVASVYS